MDASSFAVSPPYNEDRMGRNRRLIAAPYSRYRPIPASRLAVVPRWALRVALRYSVAATCMTATALRKMTLET